MYSNIPYAHLKLEFVTSNQNFNYRFGDFVVLFSLDNCHKTYYSNKDERIQNFFMKNIY